MKRIIALILVLVTALAISSCSLFAKDLGTTDGSATIEDYNDAIKNTTPNKVTILTEYQNINPEITLSGEYIVTYNVDGTATVNYSYESLAPIGSESLMEVKSGTAEVSSNGKVTGSLDKLVAATVAKQVQLNKKKMEYTISMGVLNAVVKAEDTQKILGTAIGADASIDMRITDDGKIGSYSINYATSTGMAYIICIYN